MAIEVRIPTILRAYTGGEKAVAGGGATLGELIKDLDVRFLAGLDTPVRDGDIVTVLPAVAGG
jgi:molybdopterin synthase sulfur carrier subunit